MDCHKGVTQGVKKRVHKNRRVCQMRGHCCHLTPGQAYTRPPASHIFFACSRCSLDHFCSKECLAMHVEAAHPKDAPRYCDAQVTEAAAAHILTALCTYLCAPTVESAIATLLWCRIVADQAAPQLDVSKNNTACSNCHILTDMVSFMVNILLALSFWGLLLLLKTCCSRMNLKVWLQYDLSLAFVFASERWVCSYRTATKTCPFCASSRSGELKLVLLLSTDQLANVLLFLVANKSWELVDADELFNLPVRMVDVKCPAELHRHCPNVPMLAQRRPSF